MQEGDLAPKGGPSGYNYHLRQQLVGLGANNIHFLPGYDQAARGANKLVNNISWKPLKIILTITKSIVRKTKQLYGSNKKSIVDLNDYDIVHFHSTMKMYRCMDSLNSYKGKVVLTSHCPTLESLQYIDMLTDWEKKHMMWLYKNLIKIDQYAFGRADYIVFPCPDAEEPYFNNWTEYKNIKESKKDNYRYILTGTEKRTAKRTRAEICKEYRIPEDAFILSYAGRHNEIKGYDVLKEIGEKVLSKYPNAYFLIAGAEEPLKGLNHDRWIEVGWTTDPHSLIAASDAFVLPNKETYFDLIMLEVLSLGKIVIASSTGGNKYFEKIEAKGVMTYKSPEEALSLIDKLYTMTSEEKIMLQKANEKLFDELFSLDVFGKNYVELINSL